MFFFLSNLFSFFEMKLHRVPTGSDQWILTDKPSIKPPAKTKIPPKTTSPNKKEKWSHPSKSDSRFLIPIDFYLIAKTGFVVVLTTLKRRAWRKNVKISTKRKIFVIFTFAILYSTWEIAHFSFRASYYLFRAGKTNESCQKLLRGGCIKPQNLMRLMRCRSSTIPLLEYHVNRERMMQNGWSRRGRAHVSAAPMLPMPIIPRTAE